MWSEAKASFLRTSGEILADVNRWKDKVVNAFRTAKANIKKVWDGLKDVVKQPITWIKDNVYNKPLVPVWNRVAGLVNGPTLKAYAAGGEITGPRHGRDNVLGVSANGTATARVEPGEWIAPRWMSSLFPALEDIRKRGRAALQEPGDPKGLPGFAGGGVVGWMKGLASSAGAKLGDLKDRMKDWALGGLRALAEKILNPVKDAIGKAMPSSRGRRHSRRHRQKSHQPDLGQDQNLGCGGDADGWPGRQRHRFGRLGFDLYRLAQVPAPGTSRPTPAMIRERQDHETSGRPARPSLRLHAASAPFGM